MVSGGTSDGTALMERIKHIGQTTLKDSRDALRDIALDDQTRKSLTEYEEHRLTENVKAGRQIYSIEMRSEFTDFDQKLRAITAALNESGEVMSTLPSVDPGGTGIGFRLLFGSAIDEKAVEVIAPDAKIKSLRPAPARDVDEISLRSASPTVRVDIAKLDALMNIIGELHTLTAKVEKNRDLTRKLNELQKLAIDLRMVPVGQIYAKVS